MKGVALYNLYQIKMTPGINGQSWVFKDTLKETFRDIVELPSAGWGWRSYNKGERDRLRFLRINNTLSNRLFLSRT